LISFNAFKRFVDAIEAFARVKLRAGFSFSRLKAGCLFLPLDVDFLCELLQPLSDVFVREGLLLLDGEEEVWGLLENVGDGGEAAAVTGFGAGRVRRGNCL
jgi:hypothetical protein